MLDWKRLSEVMSMAREAAQEEKKRDPKDGGSCNMDFVYISATGIREATARNHGYSAFKAGWHGRVMKVYNGDGQADLNARMVQTVYKVLKQEGFDAGVYYQMD